MDSATPRPAFLSHPIAVRSPLQPRLRRAVCEPSLSRTRPRLRHLHFRLSCTAAASSSADDGTYSSPPPTPTPNDPTSTSRPSTDEVFAIDAGRDLFFPGMTEDMAIAILDVPFGSHAGKDDRFIAAERLKFFVSSRSTSALLRFVTRFDSSPTTPYMLEDVVARRKAVETLGRSRGAYLRSETIAALQALLADDDGYLVDAAVWALGELGVAGKAVEAVLDNDNEQVDKRTVVHALLRGGLQTDEVTVGKVRALVDAPAPRVAIAARAFVAAATGDEALKNGLLEYLRSDNLDLRRCAIEDVSLIGYTGGIQAIATCPNSLVLRSKAIRKLLDQRENDEKQQLSTDDCVLLDRLIWDHPGDLDLLGTVKDTARARAADRNVRQLYKNDALVAYIAARTLAEDWRDGDDDRVGDMVLQSYNDLTYFDYFGAYHVYKTLGWLKHSPALSLLVENAQQLPPRFFNHKAGAVTALAEVAGRGSDTDRDTVLQVVRGIVKDSNIWEVTYACLVAAERLGDEGEMRSYLLQHSSDWLIKARCENELDMQHLRSDFHLH